MKILHVYKDFDPPVHGGIEGHIARLCRYQQQWGEVDVLTCSRSILTRSVIHGGTRVTEVGEWGRFQRAPIAPAFPWHLRRSDADVVVLHLPNPTAEVAWLLAPSGAALVIRYHSDVVRQARAMKVYGPLQQRLLKKAARILPTSQVYLDSSTTLAPHQARCRVVPLGIEAAAFQSPDEEAVAALHERYGSRFVLFSGMHRYYKGLKHLVAAAGAIDAPVVIAGEGPERSALMAQAASLGVEIHFPGYLAHHELVAHLHAASVFVFPSVARSEAFGISIMEAHAAGLPVVATRLGTGVEFINEDGKTGLNVAPGDDQALAEAVNRILGDPEAALSMGAYARDRIERDFDACSLAAAEWTHYEEALA